MKKTTLLKSIICAFLILFAMNANAQGLKRKSALGIRMSPMNDSISTINNTEKGKGLYIPNVMPNSTASKAGMIDKSVLLKINGHEVNNFNMLREEVQDFRDGDEISLTYSQNGKLFTKKSKGIGRPIETFEHANIVYGEVNYEGNLLRSVLYTPKNVENPPVVYYIQGYFCQSVELLSPQEITIKKLINDWVLAGYAVYRVEKPGMGDSKCDKGCMELDFNDETEAFKQGYLTLQKNKFIDNENIFLFGHSIGGIIAPVLAEELNPKGVMTYGTAVNSWFEYMQELTRVQGEIFNSPFEEIERDLRRSTPFWYQLFVEKKTNLEIIEDESIAAILEEEGILEDLKNGYFMQRHYTYWATLNDLSMFNTWLNVKCDVLAIHGEFDIQALNANHVKTIAAIVNSNHPGKGTYKIISNADHGFVYFETLEDNVNSLNNGEYGLRLHDSYNSGVALSTIQWMNNTIKKQ